MRLPFSSLMVTVIVRFMVWIVATDGRFSRAVEEAATATEEAGPATGHFADLGLEGAAALEFGLGDEGGELVAWAPRIAEDVGLLVVLADLAQLTVAEA